MLHSSTFPCGYCHFKVKYDQYLFRLSRLTDANGRHLRYSSHLHQDSPPQGLIVQFMNYESDRSFLTKAFTNFYQDAWGNLTAAGIDPGNVILATKYDDFAPVQKAQFASTLEYKYFLSYATDYANPFYGQEYYVSDSKSLGQLSHSSSPCKTP